MPERELTDNSINNSSSEVAARVTTQFLHFHFHRRGFSVEKSKDREPYRHELIRDYQETQVYHLRLLSFADFSLSLSSIGFSRSVDRTVFRLANRVNVLKIRRLKIVGLAVVERPIEPRDIGDRSIERVERR